MEKVLNDFKDVALNAAYKLAPNAAVPLLASLIDSNFLDELKDVLRDEGTERYDFFMNRLKLVFGLFIEDSSQQRAYFSRAAGTETDAAIKIVEDLVGEFNHFLSNTRAKSDHVSLDIVELFNNLYENVNNTDSSNSSNSSCSSNKPSGNNDDGDGDGDGDGDVDVDGDDLWKAPSASSDTSSDSSDDETNSPDSQMTNASTNSDYKGSQYSIVIYVVVWPNEPNFIKIGFSANLNLSKIQNRYATCTVHPIFQYCTIDLTVGDAKRTYDSVIKHALVDYLYTTEESFEKAKTECSMFKLTDSDISFYEHLKNPSELYRRYEGEESLIPTYVDIINRITQQDISNLLPHGSRNINTNKRKRAVHLPWRQSFISDVYGAGHARHGSSSNSGGGSLALDPDGVFRLITWIQANHVNKQTLSILWPGIAYAEEAILLIQHFKDNKKELSINIVGFDIDESVVNIANANAIRFHVDKELQVHHQSLLVVEDELAQTTFDYIYTSGAFDAILSLKLFYLCSKYHLSLICSESIIMQFISSVKTFRLDNMPENPTRFPFTKAAALATSVWFKIASAMVYSPDAVDKSLQKRDIFVVKIAQHPNIFDLDVSNICQYADAVDIDTAKRLIYENGQWIQKFLNKFVQDRHVTGQYSGTTAPVQFSTLDTYFSYYLEELKIDNVT
jgi:hypothetical protein